jgi:hypothetical protein
MAPNLQKSVIHSDLRGLPREEQWLLMFFRLVTISALATSQILFGIFVLVPIYGPTTASLDPTRDAQSIPYDASIPESQICDSTSER